MNWGPADVRRPRAWSRLGLWGPGAPSAPLPPSPPAPVGLRGACAAETVHIISGTGSLSLHIRCHAVMVRPVQSSKSLVTRELCIARSAFCVLVCRRPHDAPNGSPYRQRRGDRGDPLQACTLPYPPLHTNLHPLSASPDARGGEERGRSADLWCTHKCALRTAGKPIFPDPDTRQNATRHPRLTTTS